MYGLLYDDYCIAGSRYVSWLPSFSVEVTHTQIIGDTRAQQLQTSQLDNMVCQPYFYFNYKYV